MVRKGIKWYYMIVISVLAVTVDNCDCGITTEIDQKSQINVKISSVAGEQVITEELRKEVEIFMERMIEEVENAAGNELGGEKQVATSVQQAITAVAGKKLNGKKPEELTLELVTRKMGTKRWPRVLWRKRGTSSTTKNIEMLVLVDCMRTEHTAETMKKAKEMVRLLSKTLMKGSNAMMESSGEGQQGGNGGKTQIWAVSGGYESYNPPLIGMEMGVYLTNRSKISLGSMNVQTQKIQLKAKYGLDEQEWEVSFRKLLKREDGLPQILTDLLDVVKNDERRDKKVEWKALHVSAEYEETSGAVVDMIGPLKAFMDYVVETMCYAVPQLVKRHTPLPHPFTITVGCDKFKLHLSTQHWTAVAKPKKSS